jgi:hypothetical protein
MWDELRYSQEKLQTSRGDLLLSSDAIVAVVFSVSDTDDLQYFGSYPRRISVVALWGTQPNGAKGQWTDVGRWCAGGQLLYLAYVWSLY